MGAIVTAVTAEQGAQDDPEFAAAIDDLPLWSAPFGLRLLETVPLDPEATVLDVGCGTGFPLLELAHRLGPRARLFGLDPWAAALARARAKCRAQALANGLLVRGVAERLKVIQAGSLHAYLAYVIVLVVGLVVLLWWRG